MSRLRTWLVSLLALLALALPALACGWLQPGTGAPAIWTPAPITTAALQPLATITSTPAIATPQIETATPVATLVVVIEDTPTMTVPVPSVAPTPTGPQIAIITEADISGAIASGIGSENGLDAVGLAVHFTGGRVRITADRLSYSLIQVNNLVLVGQLVAKDGVLEFETESVSPGGLVAAMIPTFVNQTLRQSTSQWYVESVQTSEGQIELTVR